MGQPVLPHPRGSLGRPPVSDGRLHARRFPRDLRQSGQDPAGHHLPSAEKTRRSTEAAFILLLHLVGPEHKVNSQLFSAAQSRDQAALIFSLAAKIVNQSPDLRGSIVIRDTAKELLCPELGTKYKALSAEASTAFGLSPALIIHDELGQVRGPRSSLYEALETATAAQSDPLSVIISTQAPSDNDLLSILVDDALGGHDPRTVIRFHTAADGLDPFSIEAIEAANPAFHEFMNQDEVLAMARDASRMPARQAEYENLVLNRRVQADNPFITPPLWKACGTEVGDFEGIPLYAGLDLSEVRDLTALVLIGRIDNKWHVRPTFWLPSQGVRERAQHDRVAYDVWAQQGHLKLTPGASISYEYVAEHLFELFQKYTIRKLAFDRWNFKHLTPWLEKAGFSAQMIEERFVEFGQGTASMSPALRDLEGVILERELAHGNHPVLTMCMANAVVEGKDGSNRKLSKNRSSGRIDGAVALAMAFGVAPLKDRRDRHLGVGWLT